MGRHNFDIGSTSQKFEKVKEVKVEEQEQEITKGKLVRFDDWMGGDDSSENEGQVDKKEPSDVEDYSRAFDKSQYEGKKGHLLLQLQKSFKGDERFQLTTSADFNISFKDMKMTRKQLPQTMLGALSKREEELLKVGDEEKPKKVS